MRDVASQGSSLRGALLDRARLDDLVGALAARGYRVIGPTVSDGAIVYDEIESAAELPAGWTDEQAPGIYRLKRRDDEALFGCNVGPQSLKRFLHPPRARLLTVDRDGGEVNMKGPDEEVPRYAFLGVKPCELAAVSIQDRVFVGADHRDTVYGARRRGAFVVAAHCTEAGEVCFCSSMGTGPRASAGFDIALTETIDDDGHRFLVECGSERGEEIVRELALEEAPEAICRGASEATERAARSMGRSLEADRLPQALAKSLDHPRWEEIAERCLACANCTMVCPTCFCTTVEETTDLTGNHAERWRRWDSCFTTAFTYIHGGCVRTSGMSRYRQWMTHKLSSWHDQFGVSGCVGCGRCIAWCPVGIDITEEAAAIGAERLAAKGG